MPSVSSLDADMRKLRMSRYTPKAAAEITTWMEETLGERLPSGDLLETLKDGTILCKYEVVHLSFTKHMRLTGSSSQIGKPCDSTSRYQVQEVSHAFHSDGEHFAFPARMRIAAAQHACARPLSHGGLVRVQGPGAGHPMPGRLQ